MSWPFARLLPLALAVGVLGGVMASRASGAAVTWSAPVLVDHRAPFGSHFSFAGMSCPSARFCVAVETAGRVLISGNPSAPDSSWRTARVNPGDTADGRAGELSGISCPTGSLCVAVDTAGDVLSSRDPGARSPDWRARQVDDGQLTGISCASRTLCVAVDNDGDVLASRDPTGGASTWHLKLVDQGQRSASAFAGPWLTAVSCPSRRLCVALDRAGSVVSTRNPAAARPRWRFVRLDIPGAGAPPPLPLGGSTGGISCPSVRLCVFGSGVDLVTSTAPTAGAGAWLVAQSNNPALLRFFTAVDCPSASLCVAADTAGNVITATRPAAGPTAWTVSRVDSTAGGDDLASVSCPSTHLCVAGDQAGNVVSATTPLGGASAWRLRDLHQGYTAINELSCPTASLCVGDDNAGNILVSSDPSPRPSAWKVFRLNAGPISSMTCLPMSFCFALAGNKVLTSRAPAGGPNAWEITRVDPANTPSAISCASPDLCVVAESNGNVATSTNPTGGPSAWQIVQADTADGFECGKYGPGEDCDPELDSVSCPSTSFCAASDALAGDVISSTDPAGTSAWTVAPVAEPPSFGYLECPTASLCVNFGDYSNDVIVSTDPNVPSDWRTIPLEPGPYGPSGVTCASATRCLAYDANGDVMTFKHPLGAWTTTNIDGNYSLGVTCSPHGLCIALDPRGDALTSENPTRGRRSWARAHIDDNPLTAGSCPSATFCVAADGYGKVIIGESPRKR